MEEAKTQLAQKLLDANNILVTVSRNPSVDQLAALLGLTLILNKQGKHTAAVFSGEVPSTLEFLQPEDTIEKNTDSLRDFIIALDKNKADKLRYKVEDNVVKIFITPYKTSISQDDFDFSQGDFNVDLVLGLGVQQQEDLDDAITAHGRILHDATVASINTVITGNLGTIIWNDATASSLSELVTDLVEEIFADKIDEQIATALLTGIVAETDRFRNEKTSSRTMQMSAILMGAGANQQLVASKLEEPEQPKEATESDTFHAEEEGKDESKEQDGTIEIDHDSDEGTTEPELPALELPTPTEEDSSDQIDAPQNDAPTELPPEPDLGLSEGSKLVTEPPTLGGTLTANSSQQQLDPVTDPFSLPQQDNAQLLDRKPDPLTPFPAPTEPAAAPSAQPFTPPPADWAPPVNDSQPDLPLASPGQPFGVPPEPAAPLDQPAAEPFTPPADQANATLSDLEVSVQSPHVNAEAARDEVSRAINEGIDPAAPPTEPVAALNAQPLGAGLHEPAPSLEEQIPGLSPTLEYHKQQDQDQPSDLPQNDQPTDGQNPQVVDPNAPPPVPPPIPFQFGNPPKQQ